MTWHVGDDPQAYGLWPVAHTAGNRMSIMCLVKGQDLALRICDLLNRHGTEPCDVGDLAEALLDLEERNEKQGG